MELDAPVIGADTAAPITPSWSRAPVTGASVTDEEIAALAPFGEK